MLWSPNRSKEAKVGEIGAWAHVTCKYSFTCSSINPIHENCISMHLDVVGMPQIGTNGHIIQLLMVITDNTMDGLSSTNHYHMWTNYVVIKKILYT